MSFSRRYSSREMRLLGCSQGEQHGDHNSVHGGATAATDAREKRPGVRWVAVANGLLTSCLTFSSPRADLELKYAPSTRKYRPVVPKNVTNFTIWAGDQKYVGEVPVSGFRRVTACPSREPNGTIPQSPRCSRRSCQLVLCLRCASCRLHGQTTIIPQTGARCD